MLLSFRVFTGKQIIQWLFHNKMLIKNFFKQLRNESRFIMAIGIHRAINRGGDLDSLLVQ